MTIIGSREREQDYGYLSVHRHVVLGLDEVARLVQTITDELGTRGLTTPFLLFSSLALDVNSSGVRRLVQTFLRTCVSFPVPDTERTWREEARFAAPPELAMSLRWGLARVLRVCTGNAVRGLISWDTYVEWCEAEVGKRFPLRCLGLLSIFISPYSVGLSGDSFRGSHRTPTAASPFHYNQRSLPPCSPKQLTPHPQDTLLLPFPHFLDLLFSA
jgi:Domain of unknown function (DUF1708)